MRRALLPAALLALLLMMALLVASALGRPTPEMANGATRIEQVDVSNYPTVTLYVSVRDEAGQILSGLSSADFSVLEDRAPVELEAFGGAGTEPVTSVLVVDRSGSMEDEGKMEGARTAALAFIALLRPGDQAALVTFDSQVELVQDFTDDASALTEAVERLRPEGGTALYDAVLAGTELLQERSGRRLLVVLSDGQDCREYSNSCEPRYGSSSTLTEVITAAQAAGQPVAVVGLGTRRGSAGIDEQILERIGLETGGRYLYAPRGEELAGLYAELARAVQREYRLSYTSPRPFYDGTRRDIAVQVGATTAAGGYTERHLINVVASPWVGLVLLTPLAGLLMLPGMRRARRAQGDGEIAQSEHNLLAEPQSVGALLGNAASITLADQRCNSCDTIVRASAKFCPTCGAARAIEQPRRTFCDMCGRPLVAEAKFCMVCGEPVSKRRRVP